MTLIEFLGIPQLSYEPDFPGSSAGSANIGEDDNQVMIINPCTSLPVLGKTLIDIEGNVFGSGCDNESLCSFDIDNSTFDDSILENGTLLSPILESGSFADVDTPYLNIDDTVYDDGLGDAQLDSSIDCFGSDW